LISEKKRGQYMRITNLLCFSALVQLTNFSKAAASLYMTQSAFSKQINSMETMLGIKLFDRTSRGVSLTPAGMQIAPHVNAIIDEYNQIGNIANTFKGSQQVLRIASLYEMAYYGIVDMIVRFERDKENFHVESRECSHSRMYELLKTQQTDLIIGYRELLPITNGFVGTTLRYDTLVVVVNSRHPLAAQDSIYLRDIKNERMCMPQEDPAMFSFIKHACSDADFSPWLTKSDVRTSTIKRYIRAGMRMTILPDVSARSMFNEKGFKILPLHDSPKLSLTMFADYSNLDANGKQFFQFMQDSFMMGSYFSSPPPEKCLDDE
jgi:DNA-binding transcriptional LysR family regulator